MNTGDEKTTKVSDEALKKAEVALELEAEKRLRDVKDKAATNSEAAAGAKKATNPDG